MKLPVSIQKRYGHTATVFGGKEGYKYVVLFGGWSHNWITISETALLCVGT